MKKIFIFNFLKSIYSIFILLPPILVFLLIFPSSLFSIKCNPCHKNITPIDKNHNFKCGYCHIKDNEKLKIRNEKCINIIKNPSDLKFAKYKCGKCHEDEIKRVKTSLMSTNVGIINTTRFLWGEQNSPKAKYSTVKVKNLKKIPDKKLVDDFLRKVCLRCHINTEGSKRFGEIRSSGCAACHVIYKNDGTHEHKFAKKIPSSQCLHCHNFNRVGMDYEGYFEHDYALAYRSPLPLREKIYGEYQHRLRADIHFLKGMECIDCHSKDEVMGDGNIYSFKYQAVKVRCINCHKKVHKNDNFYKKHKRLECYSCHSLWGFQDYGMHVIREDYKGYFRWKFLKDTNVPDTQKILKEAIDGYGDTSKLVDGKSVKFKNVEPKITDYIEEKKKLGVWYILWTFRRWEDPVLGINQRGKISPVRPDYQFYVTWIDKDMNVKIDNKRMKFNWNPYVPHTTIKQGRDCYSCHFNIKSLGLGYGMISKDGKILNMFDIKKNKFKIDYPLEKIINLDGKILQNFIYKNFLQLTLKVIKKLIK